MQLFLFPAHVQPNFLTVFTIGITRLQKHPIDLTAPDCVTCAEITADAICAYGTSDLLTGK